jgi:hypothetical protein
VRYVLEIDQARPRVIEGASLPSYLAGYGAATVTVREATDADASLYWIGCAGCLLGREHVHGTTLLARSAADALAGGADHA